jgi:hypothetical protein
LGSLPKKLCADLERHLLTYSFADFTFRRQTLNREVTSLLADDIFDAEDRTRKVSLASLSRYDMIKSRLW